MRRAFLCLALAVLATGCGSSAARLATPPATTTTGGLSGGVLSPPRRAQPIALHDASGRRYTLAGQRGRWTLVTFLYTHCPDVCPLIASNLNSALRVLGPKANVSVLGVSVDPKGDTPAAVRAYAHRMHLEPSFHYLVGTPTELRRVWAAWHVLAVRRKPELVDHVAYTALVDPVGMQRVLYGSGVHAEQVVHDLRLLKRRAA
ncbi:MAG: SCO family protein [Gaiellaceae bacterium]